MAGITGRNVYGGFPYGNYPGAPAQPMPGYQNPGYGWPGQPGMAQGTAPQMSKPTVHADIIQIESEAAGENEPVDAGTSQMMITKDETAILIKSVLANGETTMDIYRRIPRKAKAEEPEYVTRAEFERWIARIMERGTEDPPAEEAKPARTRKTGGAKEDERV